MGFPFDERRTTNEDEYTVTVVRPLLIIISGPPASGKTSIGRRVAHDLRMPYIGKDDIKERLFDALGVGDRSWSRKLGMATYDLLYWFVELQLQAGRSVIVESNFRAAISGPQFTQLQGDTRSRRFKSSVASIPPCSAHATRNAGAMDNGILVMWTT
jgi:hypothetical protein